MASTVTLPIAQAIGDVVGSIAIAPKVYATPPGRSGIDALPAVVVGLPEVRRRGLAEGEFQLGNRDYLLTYETAVAVELTSSEYSHGLASEIIEQVIDAIDASPDLGLPEMVDHARLTSATPIYELDAAKAKIIWDCRIEVWALVL